MKRDMNLVRAILLDIETMNQDSANEELMIDGYDNDQIVYHMSLLVEAGLVKGRVHETSQGPYVRCERLTWQGHEFLDAARDQSVWNEARNILHKTGGGAFSVWLTVLQELVKARLRDSGLLP
jgi:hypothetical protein